MALDAVSLMRARVRGTPSWPGHDPETGYVGADRSDHSQKLLADGAGHTFLKARWKLARPIAGRENNRHAPSAKQVCDRIHYGPADIHIQDRGIEAGVGCKAKSLLHFSGRANHLAAKVEHHLLDEHRDHRLVLDDENSTPCLISHALPPPRVQGQG